MDSVAFSIRFVSLAVAVSAVAFLSPELALLAIIFFGQAHFVLAYWYKFAGISSLLSSSFFRVWILVSVLLLTLGILEVFSAEFWIVVAGALFVMHNCIDDVTLLRGYADWFSILVVFNGLLLVFLLELTALAFKLTFTETKLQVAALLSLLISSTGIYLQRKRGSLFCIYAMFVALLSGVLILTVDLVPIMLVLGCIILFHYLLWYLEYARKLWGRQTKLRVFLKRVLIINAVLAGIAVLTWWGIYVPFYEYFFSETFFFIWTTIHIIFSFIPKDIKLF